MEVLIVPCYYDNYSYILINSRNREAAVVDPSESFPIIRELHKHQLTLTAILCTHHHADHIGGLDDLVDEFGAVRVIGFEGDRSRISGLNELLGDGDQFSVCGVSGLMKHTPGHTIGSVVYQLDKAMFTGDTLFGCGCGRLFEGTPEQMLGSLEKIAGCEPDTLVYCGHEYTVVNLNFARKIEPENQDIVKRLEKVEEQRAQGKPSVPSTFDEELKTNPFLRCKEPSLVAQLEYRHDIADKNAEAVFAFIRGLRNNFS